MEKKIPTPQKNLVLLSKNKLTKFLLENNKKIFKVNKISKIFPATLILDITPRLNSFMLQTPVSAFTVSSDGFITGVLEPNASGTLLNGLALIKIDTNEGLFVGKNALNVDHATFLNELMDKLPDITKSTINNFELTDLQTPDTNVSLKNGSKIIFDLNTDLDKNLSRLKLLFSQFSEAEQKNIYYVDMRFQDRGYVCNKGAACVNEIILPKNLISSTTDTISN